MNRPSALIIDDEPDIRELLEITLIRMGIDTASAQNIHEAKAQLTDKQYDLCLTDMNLPDGNGIDLVGYIQQHYPAMPVAMITAYGNVETAISALKAGAFDFISKPVDLKQLRDLVNSALSLASQSTQHAENPHARHKRILGETPAIRLLNEQISKLARSQAPVYISGESGSGKELVARLIHEQSHRASSGQFIAVNCGAIPSELVESEFFGHKKGSFSGAVEDKPGLFRAAEGGTLFLDEVADLPLPMQVKLLRAIQEKSIRPVGEQHEIKLDVRLLSATHKDLAKLVQTGQFREDLFYRINVIKLDVPPLRDRQEDIPLLAKYFLGKIAKLNHIQNASFDEAALKALSRYRFPGNVRELENIIERAFTLCEDNLIREGDLQLNSLLETHVTGDESKSLVGSANQVTDTAEMKNRAVSQSAAELIPGSHHPESSDQGHAIPARLPGQSLEAYLESIERREIEQALHDTRWNRTAAAKLLGVSFRTLRYRLKKLGLD
jgi:two-component system response regulator PilR (NtrC family)